MRINEGMEFVCLSLFGPMSIHSSQVRRYVLDVPTLSTGITRTRPTPSLIEG